MSQSLRMCVRGTGHAVPDRVVRNAEFAARLDTTDEWIMSRTGIRERRQAGEGETTASLAATACRRAIENAGMSVDEIQMIICATITPEVRFPATACFVQDLLGIEKFVPVFDISVACSGFLYGMSIAANFIHSETYKNILVVGADVMSCLADPDDRGTCILFGDGAGAAVVSEPQHADQELLHCVLYADGSRARQIWAPGGGAMEPFSPKVLNERLHFIKMRGREVYKFAVTTMLKAIDDALQESGLSIDDVAMVIPHQSNLRIIESAREKLGIPTEKMYVNIDRFGNTSAASIPICLDELRRSGRIGRGDVVLSVAFGAGLTWANAIFRL